MTYTITTPIYYINDYPHLGTAYATVLTDTLARYHRLRGEEVFFLTGTDENGEKILRAAAEREISPKQLVDEMSAYYKQAWLGLDISYDRFIRTTEPEHAAACQTIFRTLRDRGDIYKGKYEGWYCVPDETFVMESPDGLCPECGRPLERVQRDAYFFALSRYTDRLLKLYEQQPDLVLPEFRRNEVVKFIEQEGGLRDMCISRDNNGWGIPVPDDESHVMYVWFDALVNYITACGYPDDLTRLGRFWPAALHLVGKDILVRFHATLWPAMLMGVGLPLPRQILAHGMLMIDGEKMSKSRMAQQIARWADRDTTALRVTSLRPEELVRSLQDEAGLSPERSFVAVDAFRYFLVRDLPAGADAEFSLERLVERFNSDLANELGNLLNRTLTMIQKYCDSRVPPVSDGPIKDAAAEAVDGTAAGYSALQPSEALVASWGLIRRANQYIAEQQPWNLHKKGQQDELSSVLYSCAEACRIAAILLCPVLPSVSREVLRQLGLEPRAPLTWSQTEWGGLPAGARVLAPEPIFPRIEKRPETGSAASPTRAEKGQAQPGPAKAAPGDTSPNPSGTVSEPHLTDELTIEEFSRVKLRIATILSAEKIEGARKLLRLTLDLGDEQRQIVSGIADVYDAETLVGRQIAVIVNLKPATIRGVKSFGMLLAADLDGRAILLQPDQPVAPGSPIR